MTTVCDLPQDLVGEKILSKVPITSLKAIRSTCKLWESLSKDFIVGNNARSRHHEFVGFITIENKVCSLRFDPQGVNNHDDGLVHSSTKLVGLLDGVAIYKVFHYDSLVLCITRDRLKLLVWNPYLGQTKWIEPPPGKHLSKANLHMHALGHINNNDSNYKILRLGNCNGYGRVIGSEIYDSSTDSWRVLDLSPECEMDHFQTGVTLKGRSYFFARGRTDEIFVLCFDYTKERFRPHLPLPFVSEDEQSVVLSCVREDKLALLYENRQSKVLEIWVTNKIESSDAVVVLSWSKFLKVDTRSIQFAHHTKSVLHRDYGSFFIDEEKKVGVVFIDIGMMGPSQQTPHNKSLHPWRRRIHQIIENRMPSECQTSRTLFPTCVFFLSSKFTATQPPNQECCYT